MAVRDAYAPLSPEWCAHRFDPTAVELGLELHETLAHMRAQHPVVHSEEHGGFWVVTGYEEVLRVAQDWRTFSSAQGVSVPHVEMKVPALPVISDPPLQRAYKRLINPFFTPAAVAPHEGAIRDQVGRLIDAFIEDGRCEFMAAFARPFPGRVFFESFLNAPPDEADAINAMATAAVTPHNPDAPAAWEAMFRWITELVERRRGGSPHDDVVDAIISADIEGRPITEDEVIGLIQLLILGGLDTTAGALGQIMIRFCREPELPAQLRHQPELLNEVVEELLRLEPPFIAVARTATQDVELGGQPIQAGDKVLIYWASANRDEREFECPAQFDPHREPNRHLSFGAGPHRCAGSNLARTTMRVAIQELVHRLQEVRLDEGAEPIGFHSILNRAPLAVSIAFRPGERSGPNG
jgi:cytochrome P450